MHIFSVLYWFWIGHIRIRYQDLTFLRTDMILKYKHAIKLCGIWIVLQVWVLQICMKTEGKCTTIEK